MTEPTEKKAQPKRSWLSFSMRAMLVLVTLLCAALGWLGRELYQARIESEVAAKVEAVGGTVVYDYQLAAFEEAIGPKYAGYFGYEHPLDVLPTLPRAPWLDRQLGFPVQARIVRIRFKGMTSPGSVRPIHIGPEGVPTKLIAELRKLPHLERFDYHLKTLSDKSFQLLSEIPSLKQIELHCEIEPENLRELASAKKLEQVELSYHSLTDEHLAELVGFPALAEIELVGTTYISEKGIASLAQCQELDSIHIWYPRQLTDDDLRPLAQLKQLREFRADHCHFTVRAYPTFAQLPNLETLEINLNHDGSRLGHSFTKFSTLAEMESYYKRGPDAPNQPPRIQGMHDAATGKAEEDSTDESSSP